MYAELRVEMSGELTTESCECCGDITATAWGEVWSASSAIAVYRVQWTEGRFDEYGARIDLILGRWGKESGPDDRTLVRLEHRIEGDNCSVMVRDAVLVNGLKAFAAKALARSDIIGTLQAPKIFAIYDAIVDQDPRFVSLMTDDD